MQEDRPIEVFENQTGETKEECIGLLIGQRPSVGALNFQDRTPLAHLPLAANDVSLPWTTKGHHCTRAALWVLHVNNFIMRGVLPILVPQLAKQAPLDSPEDARLALPVGARKNRGTPAEVDLQGSIDASKALDFEVVDLQSVNQPITTLTASTEP